MADLWKQFVKNSNHIRGDVPALNFDYSTNISLKYNYVFIETPKVACSTIKSILQKMELDDPDFFRPGFEDIHKREYSPLIKPSQIGNLKLLNSDNFYTFCFVRNPYSRILSVYLEKIQGNKPQKNNILKFLGMNPNDKCDIPFEVFVETICKQSIREMDAHWRTQYFQTFQKTIRYNKIGKIEEIRSALPEILSEINPNYEKYMTEEKRHSQSSDEKLSEFYTSKTADLVAEKFAIDFEYFNYHKHI